MKDTDRIQSIIEQIEDMYSNKIDLYSILDESEHLLRAYNIHEARDIASITSKLKLEILNIDKFIKVNECQEVTNNIFYSKLGEPADDGLLSYKIFGMTDEDRRGTFAYISLNGFYLHPLCYKAWLNTDPRLKDCIAKTKYFSIDNNGFLVEDPRGTNGIDFLRKNLKKIKFKPAANASIRRDIKIKFLDMNRDNIFINKYIVIPVFYRDTNSRNASKGSIGVGKINQLYQQLILAARNKKDTQEYGFDTTGAIDLRIQETLLEIYDWFCGTTNKNIQNTETGYGMSGKTGIIKRANQSKTSDYAARLVITSAELKADKAEEMGVNFDTSMIPLSAAIASFAPFIKFTVRRWFEGEFVGTEQYPVMVNGKIEFKTVKDPFIQFSDERIEAEMEQFIHGYNNRLIPVTVELEDGTKTSMVFKGTFRAPNSDPESIYRRRLTWLDIFYMCTKEAVRDKMVIMSRFPIDTRTNQITTKIDISTTNETEPMYVGSNFYKNYPKFTDSDIGKDTSDMFIDTLNISNLYTGGLCADFDGDQMTVKGVFTEEANNELVEFHNSKKNFIGFGGTNMRIVNADVVQALYSLTKILPADEKKLTDPVFR